MKSSSMREKRAQEWAEKKGTGGNRQKRKKTRSEKSKMSQITPSRLIKNVSDLESTTTADLGLTDHAPLLWVKSATQGKKKRVLGKAGNT